jgi:hypothetical protein
VHPSCQTLDAIAQPHERAIPSTEQGACALPTPGHPSITAPVWFGSSSVALASVAVLRGACLCSSTVAPGSPRAGNQWWLLPHACTAPLLAVSGACRCRAGRGVPTKLSRIYPCSVHRSVASSASSNPSVEWTALRPPLTYTLGVDTVLSLQVNTPYRRNSQCDYPLPYC